MSSSAYDSPTGPTPLWAGEQVEGGWFLVLVYGQGQDVLLEDWHLVNGAALL